MTGRIQRNRRFRGTRLSLGKSSVLYLCGADGSRNCSTPRKVWLQLRRSGGKGCPLRGSISARKRLADGAGKHCLPAVSFAEQRYIKAPVSRCFPSYQNHHSSFPVGRDKELEELYTMLEENRHVFLCGIAGIGKSELAKAYAKRYIKPVSYTHLDVYKRQVYIHLYPYLNIQH